VISAFSTRNIREPRCRRPANRFGVVPRHDLMIHKSEFIRMLLNSTQTMPASRNDEESASLRCGIAELNRNTVRLITQVEELVEESKQL
jgi:hypothetical protein